MIGQSRLVFVGSQNEVKTTEKTKEKNWAGLYLRAGRAISNKEFLYYGLICGYINQVLLNWTVVGQWSATVTSVNITENIVRPNIRQ